jgi:hypothetical protein
LRLCKRLGLGLLVVNRIGLKPTSIPPLSALQASRASRSLKEFQRRVGDPNSGGSSKRPLVTAYRQDALRCVKFLKSTGASKVSDIVAQTKVDRTAAILRRDVYGWFMKLDRGIYSLSAKGEAAIVTFADVLAAV